MTKPPSIKERIITSIKAHGGYVKYWQLAEDVFPKDQFPNAWRYPTRGGPPGCYMALSRAIRVHGFHMSFSEAGAVVHTTIFMGKAMKGERH